MKKEGRDKDQIFLAGAVSPCGLLKRFSINNICHFRHLFYSSCFSYCVILGDISLALMEGRVVLIFGLEAPVLILTHSDAVCGPL